ncbi:MAG: response regulator [Chitinivibrionales bacterium]
MKIEEGMLYTIVDMPATISIDGIDDTIEDFNGTFLADHPGPLVLLKMKGISQLNKAGLMFIDKMHESIVKAKGELIIAEVNNSIETILKHLGVNDRIPVFKTILDFEKNRGLDMSVDISEVSSGPGDAASGITANNRLPTSVMIIDKSLVSRSNIRSNLEKLAIASISEAKDCAEANRMIRNGTNKIDILLINIAESGSDGASFIKNLHTLPNSAQSRCLLFMVNSADRSAVREAMSAGAQGQIPGIGTENELQECLLRMD